jgi:cephalosporin hydroxylase
MFNIKKHKTFSLDGIEKGHHASTYRGVPVIKSPFDYLILQMIITDLQPDLVVEIGTRFGGSALYLADLMNLQGKGVLHTIDVMGNNEDPLIHDHPRIKIFKEGFENYSLASAGNFKQIMVIEDGSHQYTDCLAALEKFSPIVTRGSYYIVEDGIIDDLGKSNEYDGGPSKAIREFLLAHSNYEIDREYCDLFGYNATFNVDGYLKKLN